MASVLAKFQKTELKLTLEQGLAEYRILNPHLNNTRRATPDAAIFFDIHSAMIAELKAAGTTVLIQIGTLGGAQQARHAGADGLIVQGFEAGGHIHGNQRLDEILPLIRSQLPNLPVIAAGDTWNQKSAVCCYDLGANGGSSGTWFLLSAGVTPTARNPNG